MGFKKFMMSDTPDLILQFTAMMFLVSFGLLMTVGLLVGTYQLLTVGLISVCK